MVSRNGAYFFENDNEETVTVNSERYVTLLEGFVEHQLRRLGIDPTALHFQQDEATAHTARNSMGVETFSLPTDAHNVKKHRVTKTF